MDGELRRKQEETDELKLQLEILHKVKIIIKYHYTNNITIGTFIVRKRNGSKAQDQFLISCTNLVVTCVLYCIIVP